MNFKEILHEIQRVQLETFCTVNDFKKSEHLKLLPTKHRGLYWFWTNLEFSNLASSVLEPLNKEVPIKLLIEQRKDLTNICNCRITDYTIVYNGVGAYKNIEEPGSGLRERVLQEISGNGPTVGTLNILRVSNIENWAISYFDFDAPLNQAIVGRLSADKSYREHAVTIENLWRMEFGTPILCRY